MGPTLSFSLLLAPPSQCGAGQRRGRPPRRRPPATQDTVGGARPTHVLRATRPNRSRTEWTSRRAGLRAASTPAEGASGRDGTRGHSGSGKGKRAWGWSPEWGRSTGGGRSEGGARVRSPGAQTSSRGQLRGAGAHPHLARQVVAAGTAGAHRKRARGGAGIQVFVATGLQWPWYRVRGTYSSYARQRACWTRRPDQMVAGVVSAVSAGGDAVGRKGRGGYGVPERERRGGKGSVAHGGCSGRRSRLGEGRTATSR